MKEEIKYVMMPMEVINELTAKMDLIIANISKEYREQYLSEWVTLQEAQQMLHCKEKYLEKIRKQGLLPYYQFGRKILIRREDVDAFITNNTKTTYVASLPEPVEIPEIFEFADETDRETT